MRGLWGQVVINLTLIYQFLYPEMLQIQTHETVR